MRRRTIVFAQTRLMAVDWCVRHDINPNGKDIRVISTSVPSELERIRGLNEFDYVLLGAWDQFLTAREIERFWQNIEVVPDARQLSPDSLNPI